MNDITSYFPFDTIRPSQAKMLKWIAKNWDKYDLFVINAPVAFGKSACAVALGRWSNEIHGTTVGISTPENVLVNQYKRDFKLPTLPYANQFAGRDYYLQAKEDFKYTPLKVMNNYTLLANRIYSHTQVFDESHQLVEMLQDFEGVRLWQHLDCYPKTIKTITDLLIWAATNPEDSKMKKLLALLSKNPLDYVAVHEEEMYRGKPRDSLRVYPLTPRNNKPILWPPSKVKKLVLMSATIARPDVEDLGLHNRRVGYLNVESDIPIENRPIIYRGIGTMGQHKAKDAVSKVLQEIGKIYQAEEGRGFVHTTYKLAKEIEEAYTGDKLIFHNRWDKKEKLDKWLKNPDDMRVFVGCGLTTGLDLKDDLCRWQVITKCPFPDLGDPAVMAKSQRNPEWYAWSTIKQLAQAYGRVCRGPTDTGKTFLLDSDFIRVYNNNKDLFPKWFREAVVL